jgi:uncharacterized tellurite resistance protein B-like protein
MKGQAINKLLLKTAFACMACDGHIDPKEVNLIKTLGQNENLFGDLNLEQELDSLVNEINEHGSTFLRTYLQDLVHAEIGEKEEMDIVKVAIHTINADEKVEYSEIKFFKIIRSKLKISNSKILAILPDLEEYLEQDIISESYLNNLSIEYFDSIDLPRFDSIIHAVDQDFLKGI